MKVYPCTCVQFRSFLIFFTIKWLCTRALTQGQATAKLVFSKFWSTSEVTWTNFYIRVDCSKNCKEMLGKCRPNAGTKFKQRTDPEWFDLVLKIKIVGMISLVLVDQWFHTGDLNSVFQAEIFSAQSDNLWTGQKL